MEPKLKAKWVKALCSGKYKQGKGYLKRKGRYCCLGVLGELCGIDLEKHKHYLPVKNTISFNHQCKLAGMNDKGVPFEMIAGFIKETL